MSTADNISETKSYVQLARTVALFSFVGGSVIFAVHFLWGNKIMFLIGFVYIVAVTLVNLPAAIVVAAAALRTRHRSVLGALLLMLLNIPVMIFYVWLAFAMLDTARITFTNATGHELTGMRLHGCEDIQMDNLQPGESETVWIEIPHDCSIYLSYVSGGDTTRVSVEGYLCHGMGGHRDYNIGGHNDPDAHVW
jgi:hypothetical protein